LGSTASRLRRHHAEGEGNSSIAFPFLLYDAACICLKKPNKIDEAKRLIIGYFKKKEVPQFNPEIIFLLF
jgi:hypothetical protein